MTESKVQNHQEQYLLNILIYSKHQYLLKIPLL